MRVFTSVGAALLIGAAAWLVLLPGQDAPSPRDSEGTRAELDVITRAGATAGAAERSTVPGDDLQQTAVESEPLALRDCLLAEDVRGCLVGMDLSSADPQDIAALLSDSSLPWLARIELLSSTMLSLPASDAIDTLDFIGALLAPTVRFQLLFEAAVGQSVMRNRLWAEDFAASLVGRDLFGGMDSPAGVVCAGRLLGLNADLNDHLREGVHGRWGGSRLQLKFAFVYTAAPLLGDADEFFDYSESVFRSPLLTDKMTYSSSQLAIGYACDLGAASESGAVRAEELIGLFLSDPRYSISIASQVYYEIGESGLSFLPENSRTTLMLEAKRILVEKYGEDVLTNG